MLTGAHSAIAATEPPKVVDEFLRDVLEGLSRAQKTLAPKYFYDTQGSRFFDEICNLEEYYPYRTELRLLPRVAQELDHVFREQASPGLNVVEFGAGSLHKIKPLLTSMNAIRHFTAIDISGDHLQAACDSLAHHFPELSIQAVEGDFTKPLDLDTQACTPMGFFPGSTIGNFIPDEAVDFLASARETLGPGSYMLVGVDTKKSESVLHRAYNDIKGVTARFNKNILARINRELGANFCLDDFDHCAWYNRDEGRVEMHLHSNRSQSVSLRGVEISFERGETIHTENSYKYNPTEFEALAQRAGWRTRNWWLADDAMFSMTLLYCDA
ncbi:L-histidine N(alpha)-methyltransferase [Marinimicrobium sp. ABcell2]|uniref:L-histidine N(alpha)-methyltransferase n=1 Tax=Marinimicrobium sp. ABcell2 TaxID=3069751 RepID=UPI0027AF02A9|nr:L-histidine N(alpha)-methyltransferase [Marinimicrobium sp. ABcell2]MDQ2078225.1 L-histidine N(alpha)-methyltransferase [Marinimicrobium sp. ABcell2]